MSELTVAPLRALFSARGLSGQLRQAGDRRAAPASPQSPPQTDVLFGLVPTKSAEPVTAKVMKLHEARAAGVDPHEDPANQWDFSDLYKNDTAWERAFRDLQGRIDGLSAFAGRLGESAETLTAALDTRSDVDKDLSRLYLYAMLKSDRDLANAANSERRERAGNLWTRLQEKTAFFEPELLAVGADRLRAFIRTTPGLKPHDTYIKDLIRYSPHVRSAEVEEVIASTGLIASTADDLYSTLTDTELPWPTVKIDGKDVRVSQAAYGRYRGSPDRAVREQVFDAFWSTWEKFRGTLGVALQGQLKQDWFSARVRGYSSSMEAKLDAENIPVAVFDSLVGSANDHLDTLHRYFGLRARMLGIDDLHYYDLYPPLVTSESTFGIETGKKLVLEALAPLGEDYVATVRRGFDERWMDLYPRENKRSGAYSAGSAYDVHPYVLMNYNDNFDSVSTLAHEWGHAMHSYMANAAQPYSKADYATFIAEIASTFNEELLSDYMIKNAKTDDEKLFYLGQVLEGFRTTFFRQTMFGEFEREIHKLVDSGEALSGERFQQIYGDILKKYHGHDQGVVTIDDSVTMEWAYIPHFYSSFYVYQYATSITAAGLLAREVLDGKPGALERYEKLLQSGGSDYPHELLKKAGVDMSTRAPYEALIQRMEDVMDQIEEILARKAATRRVA